MGAESLQAACELAYAVARTDAESNLALDPPASMRSFLYVSELPKRAVTVAQQAIEDDSEFRSRVASQASENAVGRAGYLWLHRPGGWAQEFERLTSGDDPLDAEPLEDTDPIDLREGGLFDPPPPPSALDAERFAPPPPPPSPADAAKGFDAAQFPEPTEEPLAAEPDPELEEVYNDLLSSPVELVNAQPPEPSEPDYSFDPGETFSPESPPISEAPMASVSLIGGSDDPQPPSFELASMGVAAVTDRANYDVPNEGNFTSFGEGDGVVLETPEMDFEADALENELSSLRGLVDRLAGEREMVVSNVPAETPAGQQPPEPLVSESVLESEIMALESDLDNAHHELKIAKADLATARTEREEAQRLQSDALKRQVDLEKELAAVREQRVEVENQASEAQVSVISLEDKLARIQSLLGEADREKNVTKSQLETMTSERNQLREDRVALKTERDDLRDRVADIDEKTGGADVGELVSANKSMTVELDATSRELARMIAQAESLEEQIATTTANADTLKTSNVEMTSRLADTELALETTRTQHEAVKTDSERLAAEVGSLRAERDGLQSQLTELQASLADLLAEKAESRQRNDADRQALNELRIERDVQMARMNDLEQADRDYEVRLSAIVRERDDLMAARDDLINERGQLRGEAAASLADKEKLHHKLADVESKIGPLEIELQAERRQREELANRLLELDDIAEQNAAELARLLEDRGSMSASLEELEAERVEVAEISSDRDSLAEQLRELQQQLETESSGSEQKLSDMSEQLAATESGRAALEQQVAELTSEMEALRLDSSDASSELARLKLAEEQTDSALADAQATIESLSSEVQSAREARAEAETQLALSDQARNSLTDQLETQTELANNRAAELEAAEARIAEAKVAEAEARIAAEVNAMAAENAALKAEEDAAAKAEEDALAFSLAAPSIMDEAEKDEKSDSEETDEADDSTSSETSVLAEPDIDLGLGVGTGSSPDDTISVDLTSLPKPFDEPVVDDLDSPTKPLESSSFAWPAPSDDEDATDPADITSLVDKAEDLQTSGLDVPTVGDDGEEDEDDLDEVSELIAKTVSSFTDGGAPDISVDDLTDTVPQPLEESIKLELSDQPLADIVEDEDTVAIADSSPQVLPEIGTAPPSIFGPKTDGASGEQEQDQVDAVSRRQSGRQRRQIEIPSDIIDDEVGVAQFVVSSPDVVLLVDGDSVAKLGWPSYAVAQQRDALVTYLADLSASSGAAPDVVFDGRIGDDESLPASRAVRIRLSTPPTEPAAALDELVDAYPEQWPIALVTDDPDLAASATERGAAVLNNGQLLDLFISE